MNVVMIGLEEGLVMTEMIVGVVDVDLEWVEVVVDLIVGEAALGGMETIVGMEMKFNFLVVLVGNKLLWRIMPSPHSTKETCLTFSLPKPVTKLFYHP
jgi:hypothetical protein